MLLNKALKGEQREKGLYVNRGGMIVSCYQLGKDWFYYPKG